MDMNGRVYLVTNVLTRDQYVGQTIRSVAVRWKEHLRLSRSASECHLHRAIRKYGTENFSIELLENTSVATLDAQEQYWINQLSPAYNMVPGGSNGLRYYWKGRKHSPEHNAGIAESNRRRTVTDETRTKMSLQRRGIPKSPEGRANIVAANKRRTGYPKPLSPAGREKVVAANKRRGKRT